MTSCLGGELLLGVTSRHASHHHLWLLSPEEHRPMALCPPLGVPLGVHKVKQLLVLGWGAVSSQPQHLHPTIQQSEPPRAGLHCWPLRWIWVSFL